MCCAHRTRKEERSLAEMAQMYNSNSILSAIVIHRMLSEGHGHNFHHINFNYETLKTQIFVKIIQLALGYEVGRQLFLVDITSRGSWASRPMYQSTGHDMSPEYKTHLQSPTLKNETFTLKNVTKHRDYCT